MDRSFIDRIEMKSFIVSDFIIGTQPEMSDVEVIGTTAFKPIWKSGEMIVTLLLEATVNTDLLFSAAFESRFVNIDYDAFTLPGEASLNPLLNMIVSGITFSTARGVLLTKYPSPSHLQVLLPILRPEDLIDSDGFRFLMFDTKNKPEQDNLFDENNK